MRKGFLLVEILLSLAVISVVLTALALEVSIPSVKRKLADRIVGNVVALDVALYNVDVQLKTESPTLNFPVPDPNSPLDLICVAKPMFWKSLPQYSAVAPYLLDNYLDPRENVAWVLQSFSAQVVLSGGKVVSLCLSVPDPQVRDYVLRSGAGFYASGGLVCRDFNGGAGYSYSVVNYNCPW